jgi:penicillin G amidase
MRRLARIAGLTLAALAGLLILAVAAAWLIARASLPTLDGRSTQPGLAAAVAVERDAEGVVTVTAQNRNDLAFGLGYAHGQDRFFQMDLMRRAAAGELSALLGPSLLPTDRELRVHRLRDVARRAADALDAPSRALLEAYVGGVNAGLASLRSRPFEYWLLGARPEPWRAEDTVLCVHAMFLQLQDYAGHLKLQRGLLRATLPESLAQFIESPAVDWDAAVDGTTLPPLQIPDVTQVDLRKLEGLPIAPPADAAPAPDPDGSNNWAVAGVHTASGAGLVANDMHLDFRVPNIWYRVRLVAPALDLDTIGVTLPGTPSIVAGSNRHIAWGFTNSYAQFGQVIRLVPSGNDPGAYSTAQGSAQLAYAEETIEVKGAPAEHLKVAVTPWGPVIGKDWEGHPYVLDWTAHDPQAVNFNLLELEQAHSVSDALRAAGTFGIPGQNLMVADADGHIGWSIAGRLPQRAGSGEELRLSTDTALGFAGWLAPDQQPHVIDPPQGLLWSANARVVGGAFSGLIGDDGMDRGARARQIRDDLAAQTKPFTPLDSLRIQLDDRALFLERWRALLERVIARVSEQGDHSQDAAHDVLARWSGHAAPDDAAFRLVYVFRREVEKRVFYMLIAPARLKAPDFKFEMLPSFEGPLWRLMEERPAHLLAKDYADWDAFLLDALRASEQVPPACRDLAGCTWGMVNAVHVAHPLSSAIPGAARLLDMPIERIPGGRYDMPRIQGPDYGASERFSVSPGHETEGYFHMPGGQSGHPLSPYYRAGFEAWATGRPTPLLPGPSAHRIELMP